MVLVEQVGHIELDFRPVQPVTAIDEAVAGGQFEQGVGLNGLIVQVAGEALAGVGSGNRAEEAAVIIGQFGACQGLGRVDHSLAGGGGDQGSRAVTNVVLIGRVVVAERAEGGPAVGEGPYSGGFEAAALDRTDVLDAVAETQDRGTERDAQQAVLELHVIDGNRALHLVEAEAPAGFHRLRAFRLEGGPQGRETGRRGRERAAGVRGFIRAEVFGIGGEQLVVAVEVPGNADLGQEGVFCLDGPGLVGAGHGRGRVLDAQRLEAGIDGQGLGDRPAVLHIEHAGLGLEIVFPLGEEGICQEVERVTGVGGAGQAVEATGLVEVVVFGPEAALDLVIAHGQGGRADHTATLDVIFGRADRDRAGYGDGGTRLVRRADRGCEIGGPPQALAFVVVAIAGQRDLKVVGDRVGQGQGTQGVVPQARSVEIGVIDAARAADIGVGAGATAQHGAVAAGVGLIDRRVGDGVGIVAGVVVPVATQATDLLQRHVLVVVLAAFRAVEEAGDLTAADGLDDAEVDLLLILLADALPLVHAVIDEGQRHRRAGRAERTGVEADETAHRVFAAEGPGDVEAEHVGGAAADESDRATQIAARSRAERARALGHVHAADVLRDDGARDVQAVVVAVAHVAQRHAVEGEAQLVLVEAAQHDARGPFIVAEGIGRLEADARKALNGLQGAGARGFDRNGGFADRGLLAALAETEDNDLVERGDRAVRLRNDGLSEGGCRSQHNAADSERERRNARQKTMVVHGCPRRPLLCRCTRERLKVAAQQTGDRSAAVP